MVKNHHSGLVSTQANRALRRHEGVPFNSRGRESAPATTDAEANNHPDPHRPLQYSLNGLGLTVREILGEVGFRELMQRRAKSGVFHLETR